MAGVLYRARRVLRAEWLPALGLAVAVAVIGGVTLALAAGVLRTATAADRYEEAQGDGFDVAIEQATGLPRADELETLPAVDSVEMATFVFGGFILEDGTAVDAIAFAGSPAAVGADLVDGRAAERADEFVASEAFLEASGLSVGDEVRFDRISRERADELGFDAFAQGPDLPSLEATLVGVVGGPSELQDEFPFAVFPATLLDDEPIGVAASPGLVSLVDGAEVEDLRAQLDALPDGDQFSLTPADWVPEEVRDAATTQARGLAVIAAIAAVAGLVVVGQLAGRQARLPDDQERSLTAIGLTRPLLLADTVARVGLPALVGATAASAVALAVSDRFPTGFMRRLEPDPGLRFEPVVHLVGPLLLVLGLAGWVAVAVVLGSRGEHPVRRMSWIDAAALRLGWARAGTGIRFAFARHGRDAGSTVAALVGLIGLVGALVAAVTFATAFEDLLEDPARQGVTFDLASGQGGGPVPEDVLAVLDADADVAALALLGNLRADVDGTPLDVTGLRPVRGEFRVVTLTGSRPAALDEIVLGAKAAEDLGVGVGDEVVVGTGAGERRLVVTGLAVIPGVEGGEGVGEGGLVTADTFAALDPDQAFGLTAAAITLRDGVSVAAASVRLSEAAGVAIGPPGPAAVIVNHDRVRSAPRVIAVVLVGLVLVSLVNVLLVSVRRWSREVAVLGSLGADHRWVAGAGHWQAAAFVAALTVLAVPLGVAAGRVVFRLLADSIGVAGDADAPVAAIGVGALLLVVVADLAVVVGLRRGRRGQLARRLTAE